MRLTLSIVLYMIQPFSSTKSTLLYTTQKTNPQKLYPSDIIAIQLSKVTNTLYKGKVYISVWDFPFEPALIISLKFAKKLGNEASYWFIYVSS